MSAADGREHMLKRHEIVVRLIDANSRRLRLDNEINGLDIERRIAERDLDAEVGNSPGAALADIEAKLAALRDESSRLEAERSWLNESLAEFDGDHRAADAAPRTGRA